MSLINLTADQVLTTTRSVRKRLDFTRSVEPELIRECLEIALQAPSGSNSQQWHFVVVTDPEKKLAVAASTVNPSQSIAREGRRLEAVRMLLQHVQSRNNVSSIRLIIWPNICTRFLCISSLALPGVSMGYLLINRRVSGVQFFQPPGASCWRPVHAG